MCLSKIYPPMDTVSGTQKDAQYGNASLEEEEEEEEEEEGCFIARVQVKLLPRHDAGQ
jgi:hypothetical protein